MKKSPEAKEEFGSESSLYDKYGVENIIPKGHLVLRHHIEQKKITW